MYVPAVDVLGVTAPVAAFIVKPTGAEVYVPPAVPMRVTACAPITLLQNGEPVYEIAAVGAAVIVTLVVVVNTGQPPDAAIV